MEKSKSEVGGNFSIREEHQLKLKAKLNEIKILKYKLMIHDDRLEEKLVFQPEITIESIQLIAGSTAIHSANSNVNIGVQETNSPRSIDEISLINTLWTRNRV